MLDLLKQLFQPSPYKFSSDMVIQSRIVETRGKGINKPLDTIRSSYVTEYNDYRVVLEVEKRLVLSSKFLKVRRVGRESSRVISDTRVDGPNVVGKFAFFTNTFDKGIRPIGLDERSPYIAYYPIIK